MRKSIPMTTILRNSIPPLLGLLLAGCDFSPKYARPATAIPQSYKSERGWKTAQPGDAVLRGKWWRIFNDPELNRIEERVGASNQTVALAAANFQAARAVVKQSQSQLFPSVTYNPSVSRARTASGKGTGTTTTQITLPVDASWEPDFWGSVHNTVKASRFDAQAAQADLENAKLGVHSDAAVDYFQIRSLDEQEAILTSSVAAYRESLKLVQSRYATGIASDQDVAQAQTQLNTAEAQATDLGIQRAQFEHALAVLAGQPAPVFAIGHSWSKTRPVSVPPGLPSALLERRPDIAAAERRVAAANAQIGVARAAFFPTLTLSGSGGIQSHSFSKLVGGSSLIWSVGSSMAGTLFDAGKRQGVSEQAWASYQATVASYRQTVLTGMQEVEDNLSKQRILARELQQQEAAVESSQRYLTLANNRYKLGIDSYINVMTAQAALLNNSRAAANVRLNQMTTAVLLIKSLGGGWDASQLTHR